MVKNPDSALGEGRSEVFGEGADTVQTPIPPPEMLSQDVPEQVVGEPTEANSLPPTPDGPPRPSTTTALEKLLGCGGVIGHFDDGLSGAVNTGAIPEPLDDPDAIGTRRVQDVKLPPARRRTVVPGTPPQSPAAALQTVRLAVPTLPSLAAGMPTLRLEPELSWLQFLEGLKSLFDEAAPDGAWTTVVNHGSGGSLMVKVNWQDMCLHALAKTNVSRDGLPRFPEKLRQLVLLIWVEMQHHISAGAGYLCVRGQLPDHVVCEPTAPVQPVPVEQVEEPSWLSGWKLAAAVAFLVTSVVLAVFFGLV